MMQNPLARFQLTQTWEQHLKNAGPTLGGEDYATPWGTPLPILDGDVEWVTPRTKAPPSWYNSGLGNAVAYRRPDGTRTVMAHCSSIDGRQAYSGNSGTVRPKPTASNPRAGAHVHVHDVAPDGRTRRRPFSTGGGAGGHTPDLEGDTVKLIPVYVNAGGTLVPLRPAPGSPLANYALIGPTGRVQTWNLDDDQVEQFRRAGQIGEPMLRSGIDWVAARVAEVSPKGTDQVAGIDYAKVGQAAREAIVKPA